MQRFATKNGKYGAGLLGTVGLGGKEYNEFYFATDKIAMNDLTAGAWASVTIGKLVLSAAYNYTWLPDSDIEAGALGMYGTGETGVASLNATILF